jgi:hypothetical protein
MNTNLNPNTKAAAESDLEPRGDVAVSIKLFMMRCTRLPIARPRAQYPRTG